MRAFCIRNFTVIYILALFTGCANIVPPTGGKKDTTPPKLVSIAPQDSLLNTRVTRIDMQFDEFIALADPAKEIQISPVMPFPLTTILAGKKLTVKIPDSLIKDKTTYRISFGNAIKDLNEGNAYKNFSYIFSTGAFFDSLKITGRVYDAETGKPAKDGFVLLYEAEEPDSAIVKQKPMYVTKVNEDGTFIMPGLPGKTFRVYALKDENDNLVYDGLNEKIGFIDSVVFPQDSVIAPIVFRLFKEIVPPDTGINKDSLNAAKKDKHTRRGAEKAESKEFIYFVGVDTANIEKRTHDINKPIRLIFNKPVDTFNTERVFLSYDSSGTEVEGAYTLNKDTVNEVLLLNAIWKENTVYTLRLLKDFATDTSGLTTTPSKYIFRTKADEDYGVIVLHIASKYYGNKFLLQVTTEKDTIYRKPISDTTVRLHRLSPDKYNLAIIEDKNENGKWDTGDLFAKKQPELVIPYTDVIELKAGWESVIDFVMPVTEAAPTKPKTRGNAPPVKGDRPGAK